MTDLFFRDLNNGNSGEINNFVSIKSKRTLIIRIMGKEDMIKDEDLTESEEYLSLRENWKVQMDALNKSNKSIIKKIDITEVYPNQQQIIKFDLSDECDEMFESYKIDFNCSKEKSVSLTTLIEHRLKELESDRDDKYSSCPEAEYAGINLHPLFFNGWKMAIEGVFIVSNDIYKCFWGIRIDIENKFSQKVVPFQFFEELSKAAIKEYKRGIACAKNYYWLKELETAKDKPILATYLVHSNIPKLIEELKKKTQGKKGKHIAIMILALEKHGMINYVDGDRTNLYKAIRGEFGDIGWDSGINKYLTPYKWKTDNKETILFKEKEIDLYSNTFINI